MEVVNTVGRRKAAVARVYVKPGKGQITINRKALEVYFPLEILQYQVKQPLLATNTVENYDIAINLDGGGITGQASAARLGIARALCEIDAEMRPVLKKAGFLTRDPREVERKKHAASSSSASVNPNDLFSAGTARVTNRNDYLYIIYIAYYLQVAPPRKIRGTGKAATRRIEEKRIKIIKHIELKCHVQILIHYWKPVRTSVT